MLSVHNLLTSNLKANLLTLVLVNCENGGIGKKLITNAFRCAADQNNCYNYIQF